MKKILLLLMLIMLYPIGALAYTNFSSYSYCGGDPINCIDPTGKDIVILNYGYDLSHQHLAMLIQNEDGKWQYYSVNGNNMYMSGYHSGGRKFNDVAVGSWDSPQEFLDSSYNVRTNDSKDDKSKNHFGFSEGYQISTTPEQDEIMRDSFSTTAETEYDVFNNNCATAVQKAMVEAGIPVSEPTMEPSYIPMSTQFGVVDVFNGYQMKCDIKMMPSSAFQSIIKFNPSGQLLQKK
jgi:hypothetical protein